LRSRSAATARAVANSFVDYTTVCSVFDTIFAITARRVCRTGASGIVRCEQTMSAPITRVTTVAGWLARRIDPATTRPTIRFRTGDSRCNLPAPDQATAAARPGRPGCRATAAAGRSGQSDGQTVVVTGAAARRPGCRTSVIDQKEIRRSTTDRGPPGARDRAYVDQAGMRAASPRCTCAAPEQPC
jgi:hypothetical protein